MNQVAVLRDKPVAGALTLLLGMVLDNNGIQDLTRALKVALDNDCARVFVDCSKLQFLSSSGVGLFVSYCIRFEGKGKELVFVGISDAAMSVLSELDALDQLTVRGDMSADIEPR